MTNLNLILSLKDEFEHQPKWIKREKIWIYFPEETAGAFGGAAFNLREKFDEERLLSTHLWNSVWDHSTIKRGKSTNQ